MLILACACNENNESTAPLEHQDVASLIAASDSVPADGATLTVLTAQLEANSSLARNKRTVVFSTTAGRFAASEGTTVAVVADAEGKAEAFLEAPDVPTTAIVRASGDVTTLYRTITFTSAHPTSLLIEPDRFRIHGTEEITLTVSLRRASGKVTSGTEVYFTARRVGGDSIGRFGIPSLSDADGKLTVRFTPADTAYLGAVAIQAIVSTAPSVTAGTIIDVIAPH